MLLLADQRGQRKWVRFGRFGTSEQESMRALLNSLTHVAELLAAASQQLTTYNSK
jgi:hypothetical protein